MWIQNPALMKQYQEGRPQAYDLIVEKDLIVQLTKRAENRDKVKSTAFDHPKLKTGKPKKLADYTESAREAYKKPNTIPIQDTVRLLQFRKQRLPIFLSYRS